MPDAVPCYFCIFASWGALPRFPGPPPHQQLLFMRENCPRLRGSGMIAVGQWMQLASNFDSARSTATTRGCHKLKSRQTATTCASSTTQRRQLVSAVLRACSAGSSGFFPLRHLPPSLAVCFCSTDPIALTTCDPLLSFIEVRLTGRPTLFGIFWARVQSFTQALQFRSESLERVGKSKNLVVFRVAHSANKAVTRF